MCFIIHQCNIITIHDFDAFLLQVFLFKLPEKTTLNALFLLMIVYKMTLNYFSLLGLPENFFIDSEMLEKKYHALAMRFHPDKTAMQSAFEQKQSVMMAATINQAYQILKNPIDRAAYLLTQRGLDVDAPEHTQFAPEFLMQQMSWRERLLDAKSTQNQVELNALKDEIEHEQNQLNQTLNQLFIQEDWQNAAQMVRQGRFFNKIHQEVLMAL